MNILVIGGSGFIGSHVVDKLIEREYHVTVFDIMKPHRPDIEFIMGDVTSLDELKTATNDIDYIYHIAALSNINRVIEEPVKAVELNIFSTAKVLEAARRSDVKRVFFASTYFVDSGKGHLYTTCKTASEMICKDYFTLYGLSFTILRYGTAYGPRSRSDDVISIFVQKALSHQPLIIHGNGNQSRNFIYVEDLADGNIAALHNNAINQTYVFEGKIQITINEVAEMIHKQIGDIKIIYDEKTRPDDCDHIPKIFNKKIRNELGWEPKTSFEEGVCKYINWYNNFMSENRMSV